MRIILALVLAMSFPAFNAGAGPQYTPKADLMKRAAAASPSRARGPASAITYETVGDPASFGKNVIYLGLAQTDSVLLEIDCSAVPQSEFSTCIPIQPAPGVTMFNESDLASIALPGRASKSLICFTLTPLVNWQFHNTTGAFQPFAHVFVRATVRIESDALNDPALIDPSTGLPYDGEMNLTLSTFAEDRSLDVNERESAFRAYSRSCIAGVLNHHNLSLNGFSDAQIRRLFREPMTLHFGLAGSTSMVDYGNFFYGIRLYGDK